MSGIYSYGFMFLFFSDSMHTRGEIRRRSVALISPCHNIKGSLDLQVWLQQAISTSAHACYSHADLKKANL